MKFLETLDSVLVLSFIFKILMYRDTKNIVLIVFMDVYNIADNVLCIIKSLL